MTLRMTLKMTLWVTPKLRTPIIWGSPTFVPLFDGLIMNLIGTQSHNERYP